MAHNSPDLNPVDYKIWGSRSSVCTRCRSTMSTNSSSDWLKFGAVCSKVLLTPQGQYWAGRTTRPNNGTPNMAAAHRLCPELVAILGGDLIRGYMIWFGVNRRHGIWIFIQTTRRNGSTSNVFGKVTPVESIYLLLQNSRHSPDLHRWLSWSRRADTRAAVSWGVQLSASRCSNVTT